jgi:hypothetical protein
VDKLEGSDLAKRRVKVVLETISGEKTVAEACKALGIGEARFHELRARVLAGALAASEPGRPGRPVKAAQPAPDEVAELKAELLETRIELQAARIREEIAIAMPHLLEPRKKKVQDIAKLPPQGRPPAGPRSGT